MWIGTQAAASLQLTPEVLELLSGNAAFKECAGVNARRRVTLKVNDISIAAVV